MEPNNSLTLFDRWRNLSLSHKFALSSLVLILVAFPIAILLTLKPVNPFSKANLPITPPGDISPAFISFVPSNLNVQPNENFSVAVQLNTGDYDATGADVTVTFSTSKLEVVDVLPGVFLPNSLETPDIDDDSEIGKIRFVVGADQSNPKKGIGTIALINFKSKIVDSTDLIALGEGSKVAAISTSENILVGSNTAQVTIQPQQATTLTIKLALEGITVNSDSDLPLKPITSKVQLSPVISTITNSEASTSATTIIDKIVTFNANPDKTFSGTITGLYTGSYNLFIKGPVNLRKNIGKIVLTQGENFEDISYAPLISGDIELNDNKIDLDDNSKLIEEFGPRMPQGGSLADMNFDGKVDIFDHRLIIKNFGKVGE